MKWVLIALVVLFFGGVYTSTIEEDTLDVDALYLRTVTVVELDEEADVVTVEDRQGNLWQFTGIEGLQVNDVYEMLMDDKGTTKIEDDVFIKAFYKAN